MRLASALLHGRETRGRERELRWLVARFPALASYERVVSEARAALASHHAEYVSAVSTPDMTVSLETASLLLTLCRLLRPRRIVDLGSGFSSFALRHPLASTEASMVVSVDDDPGWIERSETYLERAKVRAEKVIDWESFRRSSPGSFDLVFHDLGRMLLRTRTLPFVLSLATRSTGVVVLDDVHKKRYARAVRRELAAQRDGYHELRYLTRDPFGRFSALATALE